MNSLILIAFAFLGYILAYKFYGRFLSRRIFGLRDTTEVPSHQKNDGVDHVPTNKSILFGHHFTTIAGAGPIVGPAIGVIWGWAPAFIWVFLGPIFMGGIHDFGSLVISARSGGKSISDASAEVLGARVRNLFVFVVFVLILIVIAVFAFLISKLFQMYPACVLPIWIELPIAFWFSYMVYKRKVNFHVIAVVALMLMYVTIYMGTLYPVSLDTISGVEISHFERAKVEKAVSDLKSGKKVEEVKASLAEDGGWAEERTYGMFDELAPVYATAPGLYRMFTVTRKDNTAITGVLAYEHVKNNVREAVEIKTPGDLSVRIQRSDWKSVKPVVKGDPDAVKRNAGEASAVTLLQWDVMGIEKPVYRAFYYTDISVFNFMGLNSLTTWIVILLIYVYIASTLPVHTLLQPRDYINSHELYLGLAIIVIGLLFSAPTVHAPAFNVGNALGAPSWIPFMFVIIACGAVSGFHGLASSGTTVKQLYNEKDATFIGYGSMLLEGALAVVVIVACTAGFAGPAEWNVHYASWTAANGLGAKVGAFIWGSASFVGVLGIPMAIASAMIAVIVVSFAATTLDSATRIQRYIICEVSDIVKIPALGKTHVATIIAVGSAALLAFVSGGTGGMILWPVFGTANQMLAGLVLLVITVYLLKRGVNSIYALLPMLFLVVITTWALFIKFFEFGGNVLAGKSVTQNVVLCLISIILLVLEIWMIIESVIAYSSRKKIGPADGSKCEIDL